MHEDILAVSFGAMISAEIAAEAFTDLDAPIQHLATPDIPIPYNVALMDSVIPSTEKIKSAINDLLIF